MRGGRKRIKREKQKWQLDPKNPADEGIDHNFRSETESDLASSPVQKQESEPGRGIDNEEEVPEG